VRKKLSVWFAGIRRWISFTQVGVKEEGCMQGVRGNFGGRVVVKREDYSQVTIMAYEMQDRINVLLRQHGIDPADPLVVLAMTYQVSQMLGRDEAKKLAEAKEVGVM